MIAMPTTWREGCEFWRQWAREGDEFSSNDARRISHFYAMLAINCGKTKQSLDDPMPSRVLKIFTGLKA